MAPAELTVGLLACDDTLGALRRPVRRNRKADLNLVLATNHA